MNLVAFVVLSGLAIISAVVVIWRTNPVSSALALAFNLVAVAGFYFMLDAQFLALLQVVVYAGAIMVVVLFVIMLLNLPLQRPRPLGLVQRLLAPLLAGMFTFSLGWALWVSDGEPFPAAIEGYGTVKSVGIPLFSEFFYAFEAISLLLVVAMIGAVVLAKKEL